MQGTHMNPDYPKIRGCWLDTREEGKVTLYDYPTWREKEDAVNLPPYWNRNESVPEGHQWRKEFATIEEAEAFMAEENYGKCDMPAKFRPKRQQKAVEQSKPSMFDFDM